MTRNQNTFLLPSPTPPPEYQTQLPKFVSLKKIIISYHQTHEPAICVWVEENNHAGLLSGVGQGRDRKEPCCASNTCKDRAYNSIGGWETSPQPKSLQHKHENQSSDGLKATYMQGSHLPAFEPSKLAKTASQTK